MKVRCYGGARDGETVNFEGGAWARFPGVALPDGTYTIHDYALQLWRLKDGTKEYRLIWIPKGK